MRRRLWITVLGLAMVGCGIPSDAQPRPIPTDKLPAGLVDHGTPSPSTTPATPSTSLTIYLVAGERLIGVRRDAVRQGPDGVLQALLGGPTPDEAARGLRTALGDASGVTTTGVDGGTVLVELGRSLSTISSSDQVLAVAQIVYSFTSLPGVSAVAFTLGGRQVQVPRGTGNLAAGPLGRADFPTLAPP